MKNIALNTLAAICVLGLSGCASDGNSFPSLLGSNSQEGIYAKSSNVVNGSYTGTFVGQRVTAFRQELNLISQAQKSNERELEKLQAGIKKYINDNLYDEEKKSYVRNAEDKKMDISILGAVTPFNVFKPKENKVRNTIERINMTIRTYTGGYQRFEQDHYMNGNPWPIANLWMTLYYLQTGEKTKAKETFDFVVKTAGKHSFLGEQIDNSTLKPNWVLGLGWSHAMFVIVLEKIFGEK